MNHNIKYLNILMLLSILFTTFSCTEEDSPAGHFTIHGDTYQLNSGYFLHQSSFTVGEDHVGWAIALTSKGVKYGEGIEFTGQGEIISLSLILESNNMDFQSGTFTLGDDDHDAYSSGVYIDFNIDTQSGETYEDPDDVKVILKSLGGNTVDIQFTITFGSDIVSGNFKGTLKQLL